MNGERIRVFDLAGSPVDMGAQHGALAADEIRDYTSDRVERSADGTDMDRERILALAESMLPAHREYDADLFDEMVAMAGEAGITPAEAVIVGGYTDFIDTVRASVGTGPIEDNCTAVLVPDVRAGGAGFLAQTWDMHASATPHVVMLRLQPASGPRALVFTTVGTLGQIGMNEAGIAVGINNLTADDGAVGVTWPFVVRRALAKTSLDEAVEAVLSAPLAGGHSFLLIDAQGRGCTIEAMPSTSHVTWMEADPLIHTNHCLVDQTRSVEGDRPPALQASSIDRLAQADALLHAGEITLDRLIDLTRDERSICRHPEPPYDYESCGAAIMRPRTGDFWACWGVPSENEYEHFTTGVAWTH